MRTLLRTLLLAAALLPALAPAQIAGAAAEKRLGPVSVGLALDASSYVLGENINVRVLVRNNTPQPLTLGKGDQPSGVFEVTRANDTQRRNLARDPRGCLPRPLTLKPGEERVFDLNLTVAANLREQGKYFVAFGAIVNGIRYDTQLKAIDIVPGGVILEGTQLFANDPKRQRHLTLVRWPRGHIDRLFLRVEDTPDGRRFPTVMLGAYLPLVKPKLNIAPNGEIVLLHRATPDYYVRNVFWSLPGEFVRRSTQDLLDPATADAARLNGLRGDLDSLIQRADAQKEKPDHDTVERLHENRKPHSGSVKTR